MLQVKKQYLSVLKTSKLFQGLTDSQINEIAEKMYYCEFEKGNALVYEGEMGNELYIVVEGTVVISVIGEATHGSDEEYSTREEAQEVITLAKISAGDFFGEMSMPVNSSQNGATLSASLPVPTPISNTDFSGVNCILSIKV